MPRPIPREPPVTNAVFPVSVIRHLLAQNLGEMLGLRKSQVNRDEAGHAYLAARENLFLSYFVRTNSFRGITPDLRRSSKKKWPSIGWNSRTRNENESGRCGPR